METPFCNFLGLKLARVRAGEFVEILIGAARRRERIVAGYLNAAQVNLGFDDKEFATALARFDLLYADGQAVVWASRRLGQGVPERVNAGDFTREFIERVTAEGLKIAIVGGRPDAAGATGEGSEAAAAVSLFRSWAPALRIVYLHHGYLDEASGARVGEEIEAADPDIVLVAMGAPRQERWALRWSAAGRPRAWWCVGALLEYYAGTRRRAPVWMRRAGLEWAFRLAQEPDRLWRRYLIGNPIFAWRVARRKNIVDGG